MSGQSMMWQLRSHFRFKILGGYGVFDVDGKSSYRADDPAIAGTLSAVGASGRPPDPAEMAAAPASLGPSGLNVVILAGGQHYASLVRQVASELTACTWRSVADASICAVRPLGSTEAG
jgi:hypothetical protein